MIPLPFKTCTLGSAYRGSEVLLVPTFCVYTLSNRRPFALLDTSTMQNHTDGLALARPRAALLSSLLTPLRVIGALVLRDVRARFSRSQLGYLWAVAEPLRYVAFM